MRLWKRASGVLKDKNSILLASWAKRTTLRHPDILAAVIKATSHDEYPIDQRDVERVEKWIRASTAHIKPVLWAIKKRVEKTQSWVVGLKALILTHRLLPIATEIGRLPFDLSDFIDGGHSTTPAERAWALNAFLRSYFAFVDHKSALSFRTAAHDPRTMQPLSSFSVSRDLVVLQELQGLLDVLLQVMPHEDISSMPLVAEAMDMVIVEVSDTYDRICNGVARVLLRIYTAEKEEAKIALRVVEKAITQSKTLTSFFEYCTELGLTQNLDYYPKVKHIPKEDIQELQDIINGHTSSSSSLSLSSSSSLVSSSSLSCSSGSGPENDYLNKSSSALLMVKQEKDMMTTETMTNRLKMVIVTDEHWETFDEDNQMVLASPPIMITSTSNVRGHFCHQQELPDLISFSNLLSV